MTQAISYELIKEITSSNNIVDIISEDVQLNKKGNNYVGLCPFHNDSNPSFSVSAIKQIYKCFSCGESGNIVTYLTKKRQMSYTNAIVYLAKNIGKELDFSSLNKSELVEYNAQEQEQLEILQAANTFYKLQLLKNNAAINYLKTRNLFDSELISYFDIGFAPDFNLLSKHLNEKLGYGFDKLYSSGLINENYVEYFRNRVVFGIKNQYGQIVGFSGRTITNEVAKYLNSPESNLFNKSKILYNYFNAKDHIQSSNEVVIVEGFIDAIACYKAGIKNVVALMGVALTNQHIPLLYNYKIKLFLDNDAAGINATLKTIKTLLSNKINRIDVIINPYQKDADEILNKEGAETLKQLMQTTRGAIDFVYDTLKINFAITKNSDFNKIKEFVIEFNSYLSYLSNENKAYFKNKIKSEFNYDIDINNIYVDYQPRQIQKHPFDMNFEFPVNPKFQIKPNKKHFFDEISKFKRLKILIFMLCRNDFSNLFYSEQGLEVIFSQPAQLRDLYTEIKMFNLKINEVIEQDIFESADKAIENINIEAKLTELKEHLYQTFLKLSKFQSDQQSYSYFQEYMQQCQNDIDLQYQNAAKNDTVELNLLPYVKEAAQANEQFYIENQIKNFRRKSEYQKELANIQNKKIRIEKR
ncbi:DNA primase [Mycoplasma sp. AC1221]